MRVFYQYGGKRLLDVSLTVFVLLLLSPIYPIIAILIWCKLGSPVLFRQRRPGLYGRPFTLLKFRTMTNSCDAQGNLLPDASRLNPLGRFLRRASLDELPTLFNVLRGEMSLVGPRPLLMQYLDRYTPEQMRRHDVRPGITGWAQVNGRQGIPFSQRIAYDLWYIDHWSLWRDIKILLMTIGPVFARKGVIPGQDVADVDDLGLYPPDNTSWRE